MDESILKRLSIVTGNCPNKIAISDLQGSYSYQKLLTSAHAISSLLLNIKQENIGIMLPNIAGCFISVLAVQLLKKVPALLNFTSGNTVISTCCKTVNIEYIITSRKFVKLQELNELIALLEQQNIKILYLEELVKKLSLLDKLSAWLKTRFQKNYEYNSKAVILFTSGSESLPKAVVLSHENILANVRQITTRIKLEEGDIMFNVLPMFHSFGLTAGTLLPLICGIKTILYPSPLHYKAIPKEIKKSQATIMFGTDTFLSNYAKYATKSDLSNLRYVFAGAEKLRSETYHDWQSKYGINICQGYGVTETSPVIAVNSNELFREGTVGQILPEIEYKIEQIKGIKEGGKLLVKGPNIMLGYLKPDSTLLPQNGSYYDTGDIVTIDEDGFLTITGRLKRFAKLAGEMVSLTAVEDCIKKIWPNNTHAVLSTPSKTKGEELLLVTDYQLAEQNKLIDGFRSYGFDSLYIPRKIHIVQEIPLLATGKIDYTQLIALKEMCG